MNKKAIAQALVDVLSYLAIMVIIGVFYMAITFQNNKLKMDISSEVKSKALSGIIVSYLNFPADNRTNADMIISLIESGKIDSFRMDYFDEYYKRSGYCVRDITFYRGKERLAMHSTRECILQGLTFNTKREELNKAWVLLPSQSGTIYMIEAGGFWVRP